MSIFARSTYSYANYEAFRPTYPPGLFRTVLKYHNQHRTPPPAGGQGLLLELGCGHALVSRELAPHFTAVVATDPSEGMVAEAKRLTADLKVYIRRAGAEDLSFVADGTVDLAVAAQAAHWFDFGRAWPELARVVRRGGSLAFWGYSDAVLPRYPQTAPVFEHFVYGRGEVAPGIEGMDRFWEKPGRSILENLLRDIVPPAEDWHDCRRVEYEPDPATIPGSLDDLPESAFLRKKLKLGELEGYFRTYSSYSAWKDTYPDKKSRADGGEGDIVDVMFDQVIDAVPEWKSMGENWRGAEVDAVWETAVILARRK